MILDDFRPGMRAELKQAHAVYFKKSKLYKNEVRELASHLGLPVWDKPASCSLASRIPYGIEIDKHKIEQIDQAEIFLAKLGLPQVRVRHHGNVARIEVTPEEITELVKHRDQIQLKLTSLGFAYVSLDLRGYRTGSMNEELPESLLESTDQAVGV